MKNSSVSSEKLLDRIRRLVQYLGMNHSTIPAEPTDMPQHDDTDPYMRVTFGLGLKLKPFKTESES